MTLRTPGVYIGEEHAFPNSIISIPTAVPAFVGYTQKADHNGRPLVFRSQYITSLADFIACFGTGPDHRFYFGPATAEEADVMVNGKPYALTPVTGTGFLLYRAMQLYFANGGGPCCIVSAGTFAQGPENLQGNLVKGIDVLLTETEPSLLVAPDAMLLSFEACIAVQQHMLKHCGEKTKSRFAILDVPGGFKSRTFDNADVVTKFRQSINSYLDFGAAYYPWLQTSVVAESTLSYQNIKNTNALKDVLGSEADVIYEGDKKQQVKAAIMKIGTDEDVKPVNQALLNVSPGYKQILEALRRKLNLLPPSPAMAGIYAKTDNTRGVWKAPANVSLSQVAAPAVNISHYEQEDLNVPLDGKSVNAIRSFVGEGTLVWGARTLDGNSSDWRYLNVRRTLIFIEQSIKAGTKSFVFEPNTATTWVSLKGMIANFLTNVWKQGGLTGNTPGDAFQVEVGLGTTMVPEDILEGMLTVSVKVAVSRPAEFIEITFRQQMQRS